MFKNSNCLLVKIAKTQAVKSADYSSTASCLRSAWKGPFVHHSLLNPNGEVYKNAKIMCRSSAIPMSMVGLNVFIHSGKDFKKVAITRERVGYKFGEFVMTRKMRSPSETKNVVKKKVDKKK